MADDSVEPDKVYSPEQLVHHAYIAAIRLLGSRDHSVFELTRKLRKREHSDEAIHAAIGELAELNYVNDVRYAELYTEQLINRGYGPLSVRSKLRERGVEPACVNAALAQQSVSWSELAQVALEKRFDSETILSQEKRDEARMSRFLAARGFSSGDSLKALRLARDAL